MAGNYRLGIDIGGTFTDAMVADEGGAVIATLKTPSVPSAPEQAILNALRELKELTVDPGEISLFVHGTTLGVNTLIERSGANTGLLVTGGFQDVLEIRRLRLENTTDFYDDKTVPLVPRHLVKEITERMLADGRAYRQIDLNQVRQAVSELVAEGVTAVAICFLHAYKNAAHEQAARDVIRREYPGLFVCTSSDIWPQQREYERGLVTVMNAYIGSRMAGYFQNLERGAAKEGLRAQVLSTKSNGGIMTAARAAEEPVRTLLSGPASGVIGAAHVARMAGFTRVVTFDMGGTSADVAVIDGDPAYSTENQVGDFPVIMPAVDVTSIGAGGGSIAWLDSAGVLKVGPKSAGADPGPACYGRGGSSAAVTDAYVHLGIIHPERFLGGKMPLNPELSASALSALGKRLGLSSQATAQAILDVATANMYASFTPLMARKGVDPRDFVLLAYGGAGPTHAFLLAREVGIGKVLVPPSPGTLCALGCIVADLRSDFVFTLYRTHLQLSDTELDAISADLAARGQKWLQEECARGILLVSSHVLYSVDMRYEGQAFDVEVALPAERRGDVMEAVRLFHEQYKSIFGVSDPEAPVSFINLRATVVGVTRKIAELTHGNLSAASPATERRQIFWDGQAMEAQVMGRSSLGERNWVGGPVIVEQYDTTTFIPPGFRVRADAHGNLIGEAL